MSACSATALAPALESVPLLLQGWKGRKMHTSQKQGIATRVDLPLE